MSKSGAKSIIGYVCTFMGMVLLTATLAIASDWTPLKRGSRIAGTAVAGVATGAAMLTGFRLLREETPLT
jgi:hypothetical protein